MQPVVAAVGGPSSAGKSRLAARVAETLAHTIVVAQDTFYRPEPPRVRVRGRTCCDWDCLQAVDVAALLEQVQAVRAQPTKHCAACRASEPAAPVRHVLLLEGTLVTEPAILEPVSPDLVAFLHAPRDLCHARRQQRTYKKEQEEEEEEEEKEGKKEERRTRGGEST